jgi:hypothetical protein
MKLPRGAARLKHLVQQSISRRIPLALCLLPLALGASRWEEVRFPGWSETLVDKMLTDSPWAHPWRGTAIQPVNTQRLTSSWAQIGGIGLPSQIPGVGWPRTPGSRTPGSRMPAPGGGSRGPGQGSTAVRLGVDLIIRWDSALPVRQAMALQEFGKGGLDQPRAAELLSRQPEEFVIELAGLPYAIVNADFERDLGKAKLILPSGKALSPVSVTVPAFGAMVNATLKFPRVSNFEASDGKIELFVHAGTLRIEEKFKVRAMTYDGRLEL